MADNLYPLTVFSFQHRFGSALNRHVHLQSCVTDGVFERVAAAGEVRFHAARPLSASDLATVTQLVRRRLVRWFCRKSFLSREAAAEMLAWQHSGFSVDASVRISPSDRDVPVYSRILIVCCGIARGRHDDRFIVHELAPRGRGCPGGTVKHTPTIDAPGISFNHGGG